MLPIALVGYAWVASGFDALTWQAALAVLVPSIVGVVLVARARRGPVPPWSSTVRVTVIAWAVLLVAFFIWELWAFLLQPDSVTPSYDHPTLSALADPILEDRGPRFAAWLVWLGLGWKLVHR